MSSIAVARTILAVISLILLGFKYWHWGRFRARFEKPQEFKLFYSSMRIIGTSSDERRRFMEESNRISCFLVVAAIVTVVLFFLPA